ncbi:invasion associated locus B family protein [Halomonas sp. McH1-25]|uniref:invasion associated locus B family protein n=1 Tax=unclassified Halomonas TaxID=2609666 RepID=UPI001EF6B6D3|nr:MULTISPECIES: invasion associated locus B family protein [unclassified Halomonas]MCG7600277.1 invasion associated locus B family protein [Halomonas sp. McH1-25]MCP1343407.1 invasion associated locus B family protein [Halomonas sp. FL8]MCP1359610.1 invasion associated locus B family protein [Halomonas sp. BBD45]MCP1366874.1 invasion associated locus B family protein [Halomonas sp. BBD48]
MLKRIKLPRRALACLAALAMTPAALAQQPSADPNVTTEQFQDWEVRCPQDVAAQGSCTMTQLVNNPDDSRPLMRVVMAYPPEIDTAAMAFFLPLGTRLAPGLQLSIDNAEPVSFPFQVCMEQGCRADLPVRPELMQQLRSGSSATLSLIGPRGNRMDLDVSLMGFTNASERIQN